MRNIHTRASRAAAAGTGVQGLLLAAETVRSGVGAYAVLLLGALAVVALATTVRLWCANCFESRLSAVLLALASALGAILNVTVGVPGGPQGHISSDVVLLVERRF